MRALLTSIVILPYLVAWIGFQLYNKWTSEACLFLTTTRNLKTPWPRSSVVSNSPCSVWVMFDFCHCTRITGEINWLWTRNCSDVYDLAWNIGASGNVVFGPRSGWIESIALDPVVAPPFWQVQAPYRALPSRLPIDRAHTWLLPSTLLVSPAKEGALQIWRFRDTISQPQYRLNDAKAWPR